MHSLVGPDLELYYLRTGNWCRFGAILCVDRCPHLTIPLGRGHGRRRGGLGPPQQEPLEHLLAFQQILNPNPLILQMGRIRSLAHRDLNCRRIKHVTEIGYHRIRSAFTDKKWTAIPCVLNGTRSGLEMTRLG